jgi:hypothetical protein
MMVGDRLTQAETAAKILSIARAYPAIGISGPRQYSSEDRHEAVIKWLIESCLEQAIITGCAKGADAIARETRIGATVHQAKSSLYIGLPYVAALARRSQDCIKDVRTNSGIWCSFPNSPCPAKVKPAPHWISGGGSGTWASLAYAAGLGLPCLVWAGQTPMPGWLQEIGRGWWIGGGLAQGAEVKQISLLGVDDGWM